MTEDGSRADILSGMMSSNMYSEHSSLLMIVATKRTEVEGLLSQLMQLDMMTSVISMNGSI